MLSPVDKKYILDLARRAIAYYFETEKILEIGVKSAPENLHVQQSCFVTLTINGQLRGCIGHTEPIQPLYQDIIENAVSSAFEDQRFLPLTDEEFKKTEIEISILTVPVELNFVGPTDLLNKLHPDIDGVIIHRGQRGATYLPQVWEDLSDKKEFLSSLCQKAGLSADDWQNSGLKVSVYQAEVINHHTNSRQNL